MKDMLRYVMRMAIGAALVATVLVVAACGSSSKSSASAPASSSSGSASSSGAASGSTSGTTIAFSEPQGASPQIQALLAGMRSEAAKHGMNVIGTDANLDPSKQISDVQAFVEKKVKAIVVWPLDDHAIQPAFAQAKAAHIPVIAIYDLVPSSYYTDLIFNATSVGQGTAQWFAQNIGPHANVAGIQGPPQVDQFRQIAEGFQAGAKQAGLNVLASQVDPKLAPPDAANIVSDWKTRFGSKLQGLFVPLGAMAAALTPLVDSSFKPKITTYGGTDECLAMLKSKFLSVCYYENVALLGRIGAWAASQAIAGKSIPKQIHLDIPPVTQQTVSSFPSLKEQMTKPYTFKPVQQNGVWTMPVFK
jgi:ABC-type sugar transport system substrate-binding protein